MIARATVCASPSPPPRPTAPFHVGVTRTAVYLAWEDQPFPGAPPTSYEIEAKGDLRNNSVWTPVFPPRYETVTCQPVNIPKRVPGLGLRYRVRACNHGGWGGFSDESEVITTKPWLEDLGSKATARAMEALMRTGGARFVLERIRRYPSSLLVQECGFYQLAAEFNKGLGVPRSSLALDIAVVVSRAMEAFSQVRKIQASGLLLLGWAARGKGDGGSLPEELVKQCLELVETAERLHSMDVAIKSHASWARSNLQSPRGSGAIEVYSGTTSEEEDVWADSAPVAEDEGEERELAEL
eukprot:jgi/Undpi1/11121/HiC_scaffold_30.g13419.m1